MTHVCLVRPRPSSAATRRTGCPGIDEAPGAIAQGALAQRCYPRKRGMAEVATFATSDQLLVVIDQVARRADAESVRIAKDVLSAGAATKVCLPDGPEEFARVLARRGSRRPVVIGDDRALLRAVSLLYRQRELAGCALSMVPVGAALSLAGARGGRAHGGGRGGAGGARRGRTAEGPAGRRERRGGAGRAADPVASRAGGSGGRADPGALRFRPRVLAADVPVAGTDPGAAPAAPRSPRRCHPARARDCGSRWTG